MSHPTHTRTHNAGPGLPRLPLSRVWVAVALALPVIVATSASMGSVDLAYHLRAGSVMLDSDALVRTDTFTFTAAGRPWIDQQWFSQVVLAQVFRSGGWLALAAVRSLLAGTALLLVYRACRARGAAVRRAAWLTLGCAALLLPTLQLRPQLFGVACFACALWLLSERHINPGRLWLLVPLTLVWANLHGTFFLAIGLIGLAWLDDVHTGIGSARQLIVVGVASMVASMCNPYGARVWEYVLKLSANDAVRGLVVEWQPTSIDSYSGAAFLVSVPLVALLLARARARLAWPMLLSLASFFLIGLMSVRGVYWWAMAAPVIISGTTAARESPERPDPATRVNALTTFVLALIVLFAFVRWLPYRSPLPVPERLVAQAPFGITRSLAGILLEGERVFNAQAWGSWFEYALPDHPVAVDSRIELIPPDVWKRYGDVSNGRDGWQQILAEWDVRVVALSRTQQGELLSRISRDAAWKLAYSDSDGSVFVRH